MIFGHRMYFAASKLLWFLIAPSNVLILIGLVGVAVIMLGRSRIALRAVGTGCVAASTLGLVVCGFLPVGEWIAAPLEARFPMCDDRSGPVDGVIVLGGGIDVWASAASGMLSLNAAGPRLIAMADFARRYPQAKIIYSGGYGALSGDAISESDILEKHLGEFGLDSTRVRFENRSRNTVENAVFTRALLNGVPEGRWLLVTSAFHMPRAMGLFRHLGFRLVACPVGFLTAQGVSVSFFGAEASHRLALVDLASREWIGLATAWLLGYSDQFFPAP
jgi:uncharacterized SAM-binding protein YcdF (DUF218 family)